MPIFVGMENILTIVLTAVCGGSIVKLFDWMLTRKENKKKAEAEAESAEVKAEGEEFKTLRDVLQDLMAMYKEQTSLVRLLQKELLESKARVASLEADRSMKLCERRGCAQREPQSGY